MVYNILKPSKLYYRFLKADFKFYRCHISKCLTEFWMCWKTLWIARSSTVCKRSVLRAYCKEKPPCLGSRRLWMWDVWEQIIFSLGYFLILFRLFLGSLCSQESFSDSYLQQEPNPNVLQLSIRCFTRDFGEPKIWPLIIIQDSFPGPGSLAVASFHWSMSCR